jgi:hypothetical protein
LSFAARNSLVLGVLVVLILAAGIYVRNFKIGEELRALDEEIQARDARIKNAPDLLGQYNSTRAELTRWEEHWNHRTKEIPREDVTAQTYAYLNDAIFSSHPIRADIEYQGTKLQSSSGYATYLLRGEASFYGLYSLIAHLENGERLMKFPKVTLRGVVSRRERGEDTFPGVQFDLEMQAYYAPNAELSTGFAWKDTLGSSIDFSPFWPMISAEIPPNREDLVEVDHSQLMAVTPGRAIINDQKGRLRSLGVGDNVYLGYVSKILPEDGIVEFVLNKAGIAETVTLTVQRQAPENLQRK